MYIYGCHILVDILCGSCFSIMFNQKPPCVLDHEITFIFSLFYSNRLRSELCMTSPQTTSRTSSSTRLYRSSSSDTRLPTLQTSSPWPPPTRPCVWSRRESSRLYPMRDVPSRLSASHGSSTFCPRARRSQWCLSCSFCSRYGSHCGAALLCDYTQLFSKSAP